MITIEEIKKQLIAAIKQSGVSQTELARQLKITQSSIAHYLKGDIAPSIDTLANICTILDLDANEILCINTQDKNDTKKAVKISDSFNNNTGNINFKA